MWDLMDFKSGFHVQGKTYLSARNQYEYDCVAGRRRMMSTTGLRRPHGPGRRPRL